MDLEYGTLSIRSSNSFPHKLQSLTITLYYKAYLLLKLLRGHFIQMIIILITIYLDFKELASFNHRHVASIIHTHTYIHTHTHIYNAIHII